MAPNQALLIAITLRNRGNTIWTSPNYALAAVNDPCNLFGAALIPVGAGDAVAPFTNYDFLWQVTAPPTEGPCALTFQMTESGVNFGPTLQHTINVVTPPNAARNWAAYE